MTLFRCASSSPDLNQSPPSTPHGPSTHKPEDLSLEGCTTTLKLLIKLMQDHNEASTRDSDDRSMSRVTGMINILDEVRGRLQSSYGNRRMAQLRRCNTELRPRRTPDSVHEDRSRSKKDLTAKKSLEMMCSSLGKEKEIMAVELSKKVHELNEMEEHINDLNNQNSMLLEKLKACNNNEEEKEKTYPSAEVEIQRGNAELLERNRLLSEQLLRAVEGYRSLKRKLKETQDEKEAMQSKMENLRKEVGAGLERVRGLKQRLDAREDQPVDIDGEVLALLNVLESVESRTSTHEMRRRTRS